MRYILVQDDKVITEAGFQTLEEAEAEANELCLNDNPVEIFKTVGIVSGPNAKFSEIIGRNEMKKRIGIPAKGQIIGDAHYGEERLLIAGEKILNRVSINTGLSSKMLEDLTGLCIINKMAVCIGELRYAYGFQFAYSWDGVRLVIVDVESEI